VTEEALPIRLLHDRVLVRPVVEQGDRKTGGGLLIPATAQVGKRLAWGEVVAVGSSARQVQASDRVLFDPEDRSEVEVRGETFVMLRERDVHAVASTRIDDSNTGLYL
jgi:chaperonin GroES